jgi:hypothetical protein
MWARASRSSRPETNSAEQRIFAVAAVFQLSGSLGGIPGCPDNGIAVATSAIDASTRERISVNTGPPRDRRWPMIPRATHAAQLAVRDPSTRS